MIEQHAQQLLHHHVQIAAPFECSIRSLVDPVERNRQSIGAIMAFLQHPKLVEIEVRVFLMGFGSAVVQRAIVDEDRIMLGFGWIDIPCQRRPRQGSQNVLRSFHPIPHGTTLSISSGRARAKSERPAVRARAAAMLVGTEMVTNVVAPAFTAFSTIS